MSYLDWLKSDEAAEAAEAFDAAYSMVWEVVGDDWYTCVPPSGYEPNPAAIEAVQVFDPGAIPIWRIQMWAVPGRRRTMPYVHAGIARHIPVTQNWHAHLQVQMPAEAEHPAPNVLATFFEGEPIAPNGPGAYIPWDWEAYEIARRDFDRMTVAEFDRLIEARKQREAEARAEWEDDLAYRKRQVEPFILKVLEEKVSDYDWKQYAHLYRAGRRKVRGPKPFVHVRGVAPAGSPVVGSHPAKEK
jgi:hypothetical protein